MLEKDVEKYLKKTIKSLGGLCMKFNSPGNSGVPDRICFMPEGYSFLIETKKPGEVPRKLQKVVIKSLTNLKHEVYVIDSKEAVDALAVVLKKRKKLGDSYQV